MKSKLKIKGSLNENMRRFGTKNLTEDDDRNNNGYPDDTESTSSFKTKSVGIRQPNSRFKEPNWQRNIRITDYDAPASWNQDPGDWSDISALEAEWRDTDEELTDEELEYLNVEHGDVVAEMYHDR